MAISLELPGSYRAFRRSIVGAVVRYRQTSDPAHFTAASRRFQTFVLSGLHRVPTGGIRIDGWMHPDAGDVSVELLQTRNPGYVIQVARSRRPDVSLALAAGRLKFGFRVIAVPQGRASSTFDFAVAGAAGTVFSLPASNDRVTEALMTPLPDSGLQVRMLDSVREVGYVDEIAASLRPLPGDRSTWLAALMSEHPDAVFELVDVRGAETAQEVVAALAERAPVPALWRSRFTSLAHEPPSQAHPDLHMVVVRRPSATASPTSVALIPRPEFRHDGASLLAVDGETMLPVPAQAWLSIDNAVVQNGSIVMQGDELVVYEHAADPVHDFVAGQWEYIYGSASRPDRALVRRLPIATGAIEEGVLIAGRNDDNWYHWLIEYAPRVMQIDDSVPKFVPLLISARTPRAGIEALRSLTDRPMVVLDPERAQRVGVLHVLAPPVQILDSTRTPWRDGLSLNPEPLRAARSTWRGAAGNRSSVGRRVFLERTSSRRGLVNEQELVSIARTRGLELVNPATLSWDGQVDLFSQSELVVGASGAVMANYLLMGEGSQIVAMTADSLSDFILPAALARVSGARFRYVTGPNTSRLRVHSSRNSWLHSDFRVPAPRFARALDEAISRLG